MSGASGSVLPTDECIDVGVVQAQPSTSLYACEVTWGNKQANQGQRDLTFLSQRGDLGNIGCQVAAVNQALGPLAKPVHAGHRVTFDGSASPIENQEGRRTKLRRQNGMWYLDCWELLNDLANTHEKLVRFLHQGQVSTASSL